MTRSVADVLAALPPPPCAPLPAPWYAGAPDGPRVMLAVEAMARHSTDEGAQLQWGLESAGYLPAGLSLRTDVPARSGEPSMSFVGLTSVPLILSLCAPSVVVAQDRREHEGRTAGGRGDPRARFVGLEALRERPDIFRLTVVKDAQSDPPYAREGAETIGAHAFVTYYSTPIVARLAGFVRPEHCVRTHHSVDAEDVPEYTPLGREGVILSGALSGAYPLRSRLAREAHLIPGCHVQRHPGYHASGCQTPAYLRTLSRFKVSVCTSSRFGYLLRKIIESVACGCVVVTDLPTDEIVPEIEGAIARVSPDTPTADVGRLCRRLCLEYGPERQAHYAARAKAWFDYRAVGRRLAEDIERLRQRYGSGPE